VCECVKAVAFSGWGIGKFKCMIVGGRLLALVKWRPFGGNIREHLSLAEPMFSVNGAACFDGTL
jgi:hypothetical protein